jgi:fructose-1,6-bisphosphatase II / sedoheptulose-1,7-bisphosphatase|tara:strand:- start:3105 stop:4052 length:948 start_codon:yes stop_codon:yes gene_type:complete
MSLEISFIDLFESVTSKAAFAASKFVGKNDKISADKAAVDVMRSEINKLDIKGKVVIGEGELDEAPMLYIGEELGTKKGIAIDIAVDPVEGTNFVAKNLPGGISVLAISEKGNLLNAPETYMNKIAVGNDVEKSAIDIDYDLKKNLSNLADCKNKKISDLTVCLLDRPRHLEIINTLDDLNINKKLITDGDVTGALLVTDKRFNVDMFIGIGGGPEGVIAASALDAYGCFFQGRFLFTENNDIKRAKSMGIKDLNKKYEINEIVLGDSIFVATGITDGDLIKGIKINKNKFISQTFITHKNSNTKEIRINESEIF